MLCLLLPDSLFQLNWARIIHLLNLFNIIVTETIDMNSLISVQVSSSNIAIYCDHIVLILFMLGLNHVKSISYHIRVVDTPRQRFDLLNGDESTQVVDFCLWIHAILLLSREIEELGAIINFFPESLLHLLFGFPEVLVLPEVIKMRENAHNIWHTMVLQKTQELKRLHLETNRGIDQNEGQVSNFG